MKTEYQKYQLIDDYLNNKLSEKEALDFERALKEDPGFREEVYDQKLANEIIIEKRFFEVSDSIDLAALATKTALTSAIKPILGLTISAGIGIISFLYFTKTPKISEHPVIVQESSQPISIQEKKETPMVAPVEEEKIPENTIEQVPQPIEEASQPEPIQQQSKELKKKVNKVETDDTYLLEIPLESNGQPVYNFNPDKGESWKIPLKGNKKAKLKILNQTGKEVYKTDIVKGSPKYWKGVSNNETQLNEGNYIYLLTLENGKVEHGYLSIKKSIDSIDDE